MWFKNENTDYSLSKNKIPYETPHGLKHNSESAKMIQNLQQTSADQQVQGSTDSGIKPPKPVSKILKI